MPNENEKTQSSVKSFLFREILSQDFKDWMDAKDHNGMHLIRRNEWISGCELLAQWNKECLKRSRFATTSNMFSKMIKKYANLRGIDFLTNKSNGQKYYALINDMNGSIL
ncbi:MAG: hypothetical protein Q8L07_04125 [Sediminibacterium sp.]|nr:hypothetical protein [Sediminibacterium sp.]